ncbi:hypothetical protein NPX13_g10929 [Xylaria arbuscula]|uniref:Uncharacterized protein n=1 Tax=Xylaria arbuscula TaxID=114810 RepID=A0A9W8N3V3_9PEZI|nr:hypothetical protein NPX13_g10929 [Xylaria arbuscula]
MSRKTQESKSHVTLSRAQALEFVDHLRKIERGLQGMKRACQELQRSLEENHLASEREHRARENRTSNRTTTPLKSSLIPTKHTRGLPSRKDSPSKSLRFMLPVRPAGQRQTDDRSKGSDKSSEKGSDKGSSKASEKGSDKRSS